MLEFIEKLAPTVGIMTVFAGVVASYVSLKSRIGNVVEDEGICRAEVKAHMADQNIHITTRSWDLLMERLKAIDGKLDRMNGKH